MHGSIRRTVLLAVVSLAALLTVGVATAGAHGGPGHSLAGASSEDLVAEAAERLDVTATRLETAIVNAAIARIDEAVADDDVESADAADLKDRARENLGYAMRISRTRVVANNLNVTVARLNNAFSEARRALIVARIDEAVEDGDLEAAEAADLKQDLADAVLPGYKPFGFHGVGFGYGGFRR